MEYENSGKGIALITASLLNKVSIIGINITKLNKPKITPTIV